MDHIWTTPFAKSWVLTPPHRKPDRITFLKKGMRLPWGGGVVTLLTLVLAEPPCSPSSASSSSNSRGSSSKAKLVISLPGPVRKEVKGEEEEEEGDEHGDTAQNTGWDGKRERRSEWNGARMNGRWGYGGEAERWSYHREGRERRNRLSSEDSLPLTEGYYCTCSGDSELGYFLLQGGGAGPVETPPHPGKPLPPLGCRLLSPLAGGVGRRVPVTTSPRLELELSPDLLCRQKMQRN